MPSLILITGMSGAGRRETSAALEEMGWYVSENLPPELIVRMVELSLQDNSPIERLAIVTDVRSRDFAGNLTGVLEDLNQSGRRPVVLFLDASDEALIKRYAAVKRQHPLQGEDTVQDGIDREREMLADVREHADIVLDTSQTSIHDLRRALESHFVKSDGAPVRVNINSFGFKHGIPADVDLLVDARFLPNPYWVPELRERRGTDKAVADYVLHQEGAEEFLTATESMIEAMLPGYRREGKSYVTLGVGCTGGHHRSVAVVEELGRRLRADGVDVKVAHRDIER